MPRRPAPRKKRRELHQAGHRRPEPQEQEKAPVKEAAAKKSTRKEAG